MANRTKLTREKRRLFCDSLRKNGNVSAAAKRVGMSRDTVYRWRELDPVFSAEWDEAVATGLDKCEQELHRRGVLGVIKPVFGTLPGKSAGSGVVGKIREYSDTCLIFLLKAARPEKFRDRYGVEVSGSGMPINLNFLPPESSGDGDGH